MAKTIYPEELLALLEEYLTDGVISPKEREVLLKKAQQLGVDNDEFELYIEAQVQKIDNEIDSAVRKQKGKVCPYCQKSVPLLADKCPHCGELITAEASKELEDIINHLEEALVDFKSGNDIAKSKANVERYIRKAKLYYENNPKVQKLLAEVETESKQIVKATKSEARNKTIGKILTKLIVGAIVIGGLFIGGKYAYNFIKDASVKIEVERAKEDPGVATEVINEAINAGDLNMAESVISAYSKNSKWKNADDIVSAVIALSESYVKAGMYDKAKSLGEYLLSGILTFTPALSNQLIEVGQCQKAMDNILSYTHNSSETACSVMRSCIDYMKKNNTSIDEIKSFIDMYYHGPGGYQESFYKQAGIK